MRSVVLTSRDESFIVKQGTTFTAIQPPNINTPQEFIAPEDMVVLYKGKVLEMEKEAGVKVLKGVDTKKRNTIIGGSIASLLAIIAGIIKKMKEKK